MKEIKKFLYDKGLPVRLEYNPSGKKLLECSEFKIFSIFNQIADSKINHIDRYVFNTGYNYNNIDQLARSRVSMLNNIYQKNESKIQEILYGG